MYNHLLERINQVLFHLSLIIGLGSLCKYFHHFFFSVRLQTNFGCNENICKVWKSNRHWGKNKTSFQSYLTCPPLIFNVSWHVCFHRMVSQGLFFHVYWSFLKASIQRCWKYFVITQMFLKKICKSFFCLFLTYCNDFSINVFCRGYLGSSYKSLPSSSIMGKEECCVAGPNKDLKADYAYDTGELLSWTS